MTRTVFTGGQVFDARSATFAPADVVIQDDRIVDVGTGLDGDQSVNVHGQTVFPGFFDCHVHVRRSTLDVGSELFEPYTLQYFKAARNLRITLALGITTVRDAAGADAGIRAAVERGLIAGPRMRIAVGMVSQSGGHADHWIPSGSRESSDPGVPPTLVDGRDSARRVIRELVRAGADQIKIAVSGGGLSAHTDPKLRQLRDDELDEIIAEAHAAGRDVMAHAHANAGAYAAVRAGVRSIEHGTLLDDDTVALMAERGTFLVPTIGAPYGLLEAAEAGATLPAGAAEKARELILTHSVSLCRALDAGVNIAMGTDSPVVPHGRNLEELGRMVEAGKPAGMTPARAWQATTWTAARLMRLQDELGSIEAGKRADLVIIDGSPDDLAGVGERVRQVWKDGVRVQSVPWTAS